MNKQIYLLIILFLAHLSLFSQKNLTKGYVITNAGDTIRGKLDNKNWDRNPRQVLFLKDGSSEIIKYKPLEIKAFSVANDIYFSKVVFVDISPTRIEEMNESINPQMKKDTAFLSAYVLGKANLYYLNDGGKLHYFIEKDTALNELLHNRYIKHENGTTLLIESQLFKSQLSDKMKDCPKVLLSIGEIDFDAPSFIKLFQKYNSCNNSNSTFIKEYEKVKYVPILYMGACMTQLIFHSDIPDFIQNATFKPAINFTAAFALNIVLPRSHYSWSFYNDLLYKHFKTTGIYEKDTDPNDPITNTYLFNCSYLKLTTMIRYQYPGKNIKPYFNIGITNGYALKYENTKTVDDVLYGLHREYMAPIFDEYKKYEAGLAGGLGLRFKKINFELRYEIGNGMSKYIRAAAITKSYYFLIGYSFK